MKNVDRKWFFGLKKAIPRTCPNLTTLFLLRSGNPDDCTDFGIIHFPKQYQEEILETLRRKVDPTYQFILKSRKDGLVSPFGIDEGKISWVIDVHEIIESDDDFLEDGLASIYLYANSPYDIGIQYLEEPLLESPQYGLSAPFLGVIVDLVGMYADVSIYAKREGNKRDLFIKQGCSAFCHESNEDSETSACLADERLTPLGQDIYSMIGRDYPGSICFDLDGFFNPSIEVRCMDDYYNYNEIRRIINGVSEMILPNLC